MSPRRPSFHALSLVAALACASHPPPESAGTVQAPSASVAPSATASEPPEPVAGLETEPGCLVIKRRFVDGETDPFASKCVSGQLKVQRSTQAFGGVRRIEGDVELSGSGLSLEGLSSLEEITGTLSIWAVDDIEDLRGLGALRRVGGNLLVSDIPELRTLGGLDRLEAVGGVGLSVNNKLTDLSALRRLRSLQALELHSLGVETLSGLEGLERIEGDLRLRNNRALHDLGALRNLRSVGTLFIKGSHVLETLHGFENLVRVEQKLAIIRNDTLRSLAGLEALTVVKPRTSVNGSFVDIEIVDNPRLPACDAVAFAKRFASHCYRCEDNLAGGPCP